MSFAIVVLIARLALVVLLYLFLIWVVRALYRDLRSVGTVSAPTASRATGVPQLMVVASGNTPYAVGQVFRLRSPTMLGREPNCDIPVEDDFVSGQHLRLILATGGWQAQDLNSTNGTRLNSARLTGSAPLKHGDILELGRFRLRFTLER
ncbi:MAG: domain containing protein [Chloroflexi bacterium]|nr:domain containing protein [Chloroflexota bacterium]